MNRIFLIFISATISLFSCCTKNKECNNDSAPCTQVQTNEDCNSPQPESVECPFTNLPSNLTHIMTIGDSSEPGQRIVIKGKVLQQDGTTPCSNIILYCYQTNANGIYPKHGNETGIFAWHGYLHGWCMTNQKGEYKIHTVRPGQYPSNEYPAHIHAVIRKTDCKTFYLCDFVFSDDPLVNDSYLTSLNCESDEGVVTLQPDSSGVYTGIRNIIPEK